MSAFDFDCELKEMPYLVEGLIPYNSLSFIIGRPGFGKSFFSEQLAISVLTGQPFMGHKVQKGNVLLIDQDTAGDIVPLRLKKFLNYYDSNIAHDRGLLYAEIQKDYKLSDDSLINIINETNREADISLVVIDSLHKVSTGLNPNDTRDMSKISRLRSCLNDKLAIIIVHHISKMSTMPPENMMTCPDPSILFMGNTAISAEADSYFVITSPDAGKQQFDKLWVRPVVKRFRLDQEPFIATFEQTDTIYHIDFDSLYSSEGLLSAIEQDIVTLFEQSPKIRTANEVHLDMGNTHGINAVRKALHSLEAKQVLICHREAHNMFRYELINKVKNKIMEVKTQ